MSKLKAKPLVLGLGFSPRPAGNSDLLLEWALAGTKESGAKGRKIFIRDLNIHYCLGCRYCESTGECIQKDDFQKLSREIDRADFLIVSTPIFFLGIPGHSKAMIDRFQTYWSRKYLLGRPPKRENRPALVLLCAGSDLKKIFDCAQRTLHAFFQVAGFQAVQELRTEAVDEKGAVKEVPGLEEKTRQAGAQLIFSPSSKVKD